MNRIRHRRLQDVPRARVEGRNVIRLAVVASGPAPATERPKTRGDCLPGGSNAARPCPFVSCRYHLFADVLEASGSIKFNFPQREPEEMPPGESCALDVADDGAAVLERVGDLTNITRERIRQIQTHAFAVMKFRGGAMLRELAVALGREVDDVQRYATHEGGAGDGDERRDPLSYPFFVPGDAGAKSDRLRAWSLYLGRRAGREDPTPDEDALTSKERGVLSAVRRRTLIEDEWTDEDDDEVEEWSVRVLAELREGRSLRSALRRVSAGKEKRRHRGGPRRRGRTIVQPKTRARKATRGTRP